MSTPMPWFRIYTELKDDPKIKRAMRLSGQPKYAIIGVWTTLLCLAGASPERGRLLISAEMPYTEEELFDECGIDPETGAAILAVLLDLRMLDNQDGTYIIVAWDKRQFDSDNSTERVRKHRARKRAANGSQPIEPAPVIEDSHQNGTPESHTEALQGGANLGQPGGDRPAYMPDEETLPETPDETLQETPPIFLKRFGNVIESDTESETDSETEGEGGRYRTVDYNVACAYARPQFPPSPPHGLGDEFFHEGVPRLPVSGRILGRGPPKLAC